MAVAGTEKIAVVGASSQIGRALLPRLVLAGYEVSRIGRKYKDEAEGIATHVFDDLSGRFSPSLGSAAAVISLAPLPTIDTVVKMARALDAQRIIAFGSTGRFSKLGSTSVIEQDFVTQQENAEALFFGSCEAAGIGWTLFRPTMIYGAGTDLNVSFIAEMSRRFGFFPIPIGATGLRQPVHVNDLADACVSALSYETTVNRAYNLGGGEVLMFSDLARRILLEAGRLPILVPIPKSLFVLLVSILRRFPRASFLRREMVDRMFQDLTVDNQPAIDDFGYSPQLFSLQQSPLNRSARV